MNRLTGIQATLAVFITLSLPAMAKSADTVDQWIAEALNNNASLGKQRASVEAAEVDRRPVFTASAGYNSLWADERKRWMVGVGVQIPLSGQRQNSAVRRAAAEVSQRQWQTTQAHRDLLGSIGEV